jgi:excisionase family DNA binding protein
MTDPLIYTLEQVAELTPLSVRTLRAWCRTGRIEHTRCGRRYGLTRKQVDALIEAGRQPASRPLTAEELAAADLAEARAANQRRRAA